MASLKSKLTQVSRLEVIQSNDLIFFLAADNPAIMKQFIGNQQLSDSTAKAYQRSVRQAINLIQSFENNQNVQLRRALERKYQLPPNLNTLDFINRIAGRRRQIQIPIPPNPPGNGTRLNFRVGRIFMEYRYNFDANLNLHQVVISIKKMFRRPYERNEINEVWRETMEFIERDINHGLNYRDVDHMFWIQLVLHALQNMGLQLFNPLPFIVQSVKLYTGYETTPNGVFWRRHAWETQQSLTIQQETQYYRDTLNGINVRPNSEFQYEAILGVFHFMNM